MSLLTVDTITLIQTLQTTSLGLAIRDAGDWLTASIGILHILGLVLLLTSVLLLNLRLLGVGLLQQSTAQIAQSARPLFWAGLVLTVFSGIILFISNAVQYYQNAAFLPKMTLLALALAFQVTVLSKVSQSPRLPQLLAKGAAVVSLTLWLATGFAGRAIGFV